MSGETVAFASDQPSTVRDVTGGGIRIVPRVGGEFRHQVGEGAR
jgi:hypothetical protein